MPRHTALKKKDRRRKICCWGSSYLADEGGRAERSRIFVTMTEAVERKQGTVHGSSQAEKCLQFWAANTFALLRIISRFWWEEGFRTSQESNTFAPLFALLLVLPLLDSWSWYGKPAGSATQPIPRKGIHFLSHRKECIFNDNIGVGWGEEYTSPLMIELNLGQNDFLGFRNYTCWKEGQQAMYSFGTRAVLCPPLAMTGMLFLSSSAASKRETENRWELVGTSSSAVWEKSLCALQC